MLVLTRKLQETLIIGDKVKLTIVEVHGDSVRIAIDAPKEIKIYRSEIYDAIAKENQASVIKSQQMAMPFIDITLPKVKRDLE